VTEGGRERKSLGERKLCTPFKLWRGEFCNLLFSFRFLLPWKVLWNYLSYNDITICRDRNTYTVTIHINKQYVHTSAYFSSFVHTVQDWNSDALGVHIHCDTPFHRACLNKLLDSTGAWVLIKIHSRHNKFKVPNLGWGLSTCDIEHVLLFNENCITVPHTWVIIRSTSRHLKHLMFQRGVIWIGHWMIYSLHQLKTFPLPHYINSHVGINTPIQYYNIPNTMILFGYPWSTKNNSKILDTHLGKLVKCHVNIATDQEVGLSFQRLESFSSFSKAW